MSKKICIVSCGSKKRSCPSKFKDLYVGVYFKKCYEYVESFNHDLILVDSAKHDILHSKEIVKLYDYALNDKSENIKRNA